VKKKIFLTLLLILTLGFITSASTIPAQGTSEWTLKIDGAVSNPTILTLNELMAMPTRTVYAEIYCYGVFVTGGNWTGVSLRVLLENVGLDQSAMSVGFYAQDGYTREISLTEAMRDDVIIAYEMNGHPLSETLRLVLPGANGDLWVSMINQMIVSTSSVSTPQSAPSTGFNPPPVQQPSPTPQPTLTPQPQSTPSPSSAPSSSPPTTNSDPEPFPITWMVTAVATVGVAGTGLIVYFKKRNQ
jgi:DMSO/TMAO reductase YedYZ molybdopterin-dependent catalytic subunit